MVALFPDPVIPITMAVICNSSSSGFSASSRSARGCMSPPPPGPSRTLSACSNLRRNHLRPSTSKFLTIPKAFLCSCGFLMVHHDGYVFTPRFLSLNPTLFRKPHPLHAPTLLACTTFCFSEKLCNNPFNFSLDRFTRVSMSSPSPTSQKPHPSLSFLTPPPPSLL
jgi:hypothetical protein